ncbi:MAG: 16S rRNA (cytosine(1402)-N(4))-methyltransferase RsmH [Candidatus Lightella neohaematopini]|nr:16S rRNA (cytosine(1402)-N(4))-methyltransferase RsmH [Candidatus Lightella neohaematopini]MCV2528748.1 16S rRNA (cytosine(1402)-N(4))-methyltransferase RsmH [Candidatus Lightella neohaematopini]
MFNKYQHNTVLLHEAVNSLKIKPNGIYIDATFGLGGHARLILSKLGKNGKLIVMDRDPLSISIARNILDQRCYIIHDNFSNMIKYIKQLNLLGRINGILLDLGISSVQLDNPDRGFSYTRNGPLDMRMNNTIGYTARYWLNHAKYNDIYLVLRNLGEERYAKYISKNICEFKKRNYIINTIDLSKIIIRSYKNINNYNKHPATKSFRAIRMFINQELKEIKLLLSYIYYILSFKGILSIISFHSLEDRIVKNFMSPINTISNVNLFNINQQLTSEINNNKKFKFLKKIKPSLNEINNNNRSRSAILRIAQKID